MNRIVPGWKKAILTPPARELLGVADLNTAESLQRLQRVTIVDTYTGLRKTRVLVVQDVLAILAVDAKVGSEEASTLYEELQLMRWQGSRRPEQCEQVVTSINSRISDCYRQLGERANMAYRFIYDCALLPAQALP